MQTIVEVILSVILVIGVLYSFIYAFRQIPKMNKTLNGVHCIALDGSALLAYAFPGLQLTAAVLLVAAGCLYSLFYLPLLLPLWLIMCFGAAKVIKKVLTVVVPDGAQAVVLMLEIHWQVLSPGSHFLPFGTRLCPLLIDGKYVRIVNMDQHVLVLKNKEVNIKRQVVEVHATQIPNKSDILLGTVSVTDRLDIADQLRVVIPKTSIYWQVTDFVKAVHSLSGDISAHLLPMVESYILHVAANLKVDYSKVNLTKKLNMNLQEGLAEENISLSRYGLSVKMIEIDPALPPAISKMLTNTALSSMN